LIHGFGFLPKLKQTIWLNASSLGETKSVGPLLKRLRLQYPHANILFSVQTQSGYEYATTNYCQYALITFQPFELPFIGNIALRRIEPLVLISIENLIWPLLFRNCHKRSVPVLLVNAKIGAKTSERYLMLSRLITQWIFQNVTVLVSSRKQFQRFLKLPLKKIEWVKELKLA
jgi:3-deoxy-D-manno-octulosonic-acid transferase